MTSRDFLEKFDNREVFTRDELTTLILSGGPNDSLLLAGEQKGCNKFVWCYLSNFFFNTKDSNRFFRIEWLKGYEPNTSAIMQPIEIKLLEPKESPINYTWEDLT